MASFGLFLTKRVLDMGHVKLILVDQFIVKLRSRSQFRSRSGPRSGPKGPRTKDQGPGLTLFKSKSLLTTCVYRVGLCWTIQMLAVISWYLHNGPLTTIELILNRDNQSLETRGTCLNIIDLSNSK